MNTYPDIFTGQQHQTVTCLYNPLTGKVAGPIFRNVEPVLIDAEAFGASVGFVAAVGNDDDREGHGRSVRRCAAR